LARGGDSEVDRRRREELEQPRRFQEDEELYGEKERSQKRFARKMVATIQKNFARTNYCPAGCPDGATTITTTTEEAAQCAAISPFVLSGSPGSMRPPPSLKAEISIGGVEDEIKIMSGKSWRQDQARRDQVMIQNLEKNPTTICIDSGAGESVCPVDFFPDYETHETEKVGNLYRAAGGQELRNVGEKRPKLKIGGVPVSMTFQATSHVRKPLAAASKITAKGNRIVLDDEESLSYIENKATGKKIPLKIQNGVYVMEVAVTPKKAPF